MKKIYAVAKGHTIGIFETWAECQKATSGFSSPIFKSFLDIEDAKSFLKKFSEEIKTPPPTNNTEINVLKKNENIDIFKKEELIKKYGYLESTLKFLNSDAEKKRMEITKSEQNLRETLTELRSCKKDFKECIQELEKYDIRYVQVYPDEESSNKTLILEFEKKNVKRRLDFSEEDSNKKKKLEDEKKFKNIFTDGSCKNNGTEKAVAGIGIYFEDEPSKNISKKLEGIETNNRAELTAIIEAIKNSNKTDNIRINTDSEYSIKGILGINKRKLNVDLFDIIDDLIEDRSGYTEFNKVKAHTGLSDGNDVADKLAADAIKIY